MTLDTMDRRLLAVLQKRGRISNADLAEAVNLSPSACHRRVQRPKFCSVNHYSLRDCLKSSHLSLRWLKPSSDKIRLDTIRWYL